jgi:hypothetical protein
LPPPPPLLLLLLLFNIRQLEKPDDLENRTLSRGTNATSPVIAAPPATACSSMAKNTVSCVCCVTGVLCSCRTRRHLLSPRPKVLEERRCSSVREEKSGDARDK